MLEDSTKPSDLEVNPEQKESYYSGHPRLLPEPRGEAEVPQDQAGASMMKLQNELEAKFAEFELPTKQLAIARNSVNVAKEFGESAFESLKDYDEPEEEKEEEKEKRIEALQRYQTAMSEKKKPSHIFMKPSYLSSVISLSTLVQKTLR